MIISSYPVLGFKYYHTPLKSQNRLFFDFSFIAIRQKVRYSI